VRDQYDGRALAVQCPEQMNDLGVPHPGCQVHPRQGSLGCPLALGARHPRIGQRSRSRESGGLGLGLTIVDRIRS
jgi:hypothetical protein